MDRLNRIFLAGLMLVGLVALGLQVPTIQEARNTTSDNQAVTDLQDITTAITTYTTSKGTLPEKLEAVSLEGEVKNRIGNYQYKPGNGTSYEICANFKTETSKDSDSESNSGVEADSELDYSYSSYNSFSKHKKGQHCFKEQAGYDYGDYDYDSLYDDDYSLDSLKENAKDTQIKTDINSIHSHLEAYYAWQGVYPSLDDLEDATWRQANMSGLYLDTGPNGEVIGDGYDYEPLAEDCQTDCYSYSLKAKLSDGSSYTKQALNSSSYVTL